MRGEEYDDAYLATDDERAQCGYRGSAARWESARRLIVRGIDRVGTLLDIGCANGLLMQSIAAWSTHAIEPYGVDFVHIRLDMCDLRDVRAFGRRVIVSSDGSFARPDSQKAEDAAAALTARGWKIAGAAYERSDEHETEISVAWT